MQRRFDFVQPAVYFGSISQGLKIWPRDSPFCLCCRPVDIPGFSRRHESSELPCVIANDARMTPKGMTEAGINTFVDGVPVGVIVNEIIREMARSESPWHKIPRLSPLTALIDKSKPWRFGDGGHAQMNRMQVCSARNCILGWSLGITSNCDLSPNSVRYV